VFAWTGLLKINWHKEMMSPEVVSIL